GQRPRWPTFGVTVLPKLAEGIHKVVPALGPLRLVGPSALLERLITTMLVGHDQAYLNQPWVCARAIQVITTDFGILDFGISRPRLEELFDRGYAVTQEFLSTWDWQDYLKRFRRYQ
ncbi:MAG: patatin-like phospholipase family protein, partial [Mycobacterium sp.]